MLYKFYRTANGWKIYDLEIQGISLIVSYRNQFDEILSTGTINDLIEQLEHPEKT
jgi:phospholipid transport system substrate-binding protein